MPHRLLRFGLSRKHPEPRMFTRHDALKAGYDVVIIGGGGHGLAAAYYLARDHGIRNSLDDRAALSGKPAPRFWPTSVAAALLIPHAGRRKKIRIRMDTW